VGCLGTLVLLILLCLSAMTGSTGGEAILGVLLGGLGIPVFWVLWFVKVAVGPTCYVCQSCGTTWFQR